MVAFHFIALGDTSEFSSFAIKPSFFPIVLAQRPFATSASPR